ncbi:hypothetical protein HG530_009441 [Fusarium avenaceum]|nr:hypothetical protein HG530_009441 [Fusarium avenaceum]
MIARAVPIGNRAAIELCLNAHVVRRTSCSYIRVASAAPVLASQPLFKYDSRDSGSKYWQLTQKGQERLMEAALRFGWPSVAETVQIILVERRRTVEQPLGDDIFKWFPIVESGRLDGDQSQRD